MKKYEGYLSSLRRRRRRIPRQWRGQDKKIVIGGATTFLVAHSMSQLWTRCNKVLWIDHGRLVAFLDDAKGICDQYEAFLAGTRKN